MTHADGPLFWLAIIEIAMGLIMPFWAFPYFSFIEPTGRVLSNVNDDSNPLVQHMRTVAGVFRACGWSHVGSSVWCFAMGFSMLFGWLAIPSAAIGLIVISQLIVGAGISMAGVAAYRRSVGMPAVSFRSCWRGMFK